MVKLRRVDEETQLDLFSWKPKETNKPKENEYDGWSDTDEKSWFNTSYMNKKFDEYNRRFFSNKIPKIPVYIKTHPHFLGVCVGMVYKKSGKIESSEIRISNRKFKNRYSMENILVHEMCHAYQTDILCNGSLVAYSQDCKKGSGSKGHGPLFFKAAEMVNNSPNNIEGFKITQYNEEIDTAIKRTSNSTGYVYIKPMLDSVKIYTIADTRNNQEQLRVLPKEYLFTYKDADVKGAITSVYGRSSHYLYPYNKILKQVCDMIKSGDLIPVVPDRDLQQKYIIKHRDGRIECITRKPIEWEEVIMNNPYSALLNRIEEHSELNMNVNDLNNVIKRFKEAIESGVYTLPNESTTNEAMDYIDIDEAEEIIADAGNTILMKDIGDDLEEIIIE